MPGIGHNDFPSGTDPEKVFKQYWGDGHVCLTGMSRTIRYANDEMGMQKIALGLRLRSETGKPHESIAALGVAAIFNVMRLWCREGHHEVEFVLRDIQRRVWCAQKIYGLEPNPAFRDIWPLYHRIAEAADKSRPAYTLASKAVNANAKQIDEMLQEQSKPQLETMRQQERLLVDAVSTLRDGIQISRG